MVLHIRYGITTSPLTAVGFSQACSRVFQGPCNEVDVHTRKRYLGPSSATGWQLICANKGSSPVPIENDGALVIRGGKTGHHE